MSAPTKVPILARSESQYQRYIRAFNLTPQNAPRLMTEEHTFGWRDGTTLVILPDALENGREHNLFRMWIRRSNPTMQL